MTTIYFSDYVSIVAIVSIILGLITGYLFKKFTRFGRVKYYLNNFRIIYLQDSLMNTREKGEITEKTNRVKINFEVRIHNYSSVYRNPRKFHLLLKGEYSGFRYEILNARQTSLPWMTSVTDRFHDIEIPPMKVVNYQLYTYVKNDGLEIFKSDQYSIYLVYTEHNSFSKVLLKRYSRNLYPKIELALSPEYQYSQVATT
ncbi:MAG TPA: hypothetical protein VI583_03655 [Cyclobacteriaceae bacterium]|nr:hypothetical protein [Cyclobacteriaceae bacterium]